MEEEATKSAITIIFYKLSFGACIEIGWVDKSRKGISHRGNSVFKNVRQE